MDRPIDRPARSAMSEAAKVVPYAPAVRGRHSPIARRGVQERIGSADNLDVIAKRGYMAVAISLTRRHGCQRLQ
jgi:hypothetical protein